MIIGIRSFIAPWWSSDPMGERPMLNPMTVRFSVVMSAAARFAVCPLALP